MKNMIKTNAIYLSLGALLVLSACSSESQRIDYKATSMRVPKLESPPDLSTPTANEQNTMPGGDQAVVASFSNYAQTLSNAVLPKLTKVSLEKNDSERWLLVQASAESVWTKLNVFWLSMGFQIRVDNPAAGVMETDWQENVGNAPQHYLRTVTGNGKAVDRLTPAGQRDQYLTRIERNADGSTRVYVQRQAMQQFSTGGNNVRWLPIANELNIQNAVLQMMMTELAQQASKPLPAVVEVATASEVVAAPVIVARPELITANGQREIHFTEAFDKAWRKVGLALDKARLAVEDKDRSTGVILLRAALDKDGKKLPAYQVTVQDGGANCDVRVLNAAGASDAESVRLLELLFKNIEP